MDSSNMAKSSVSTDSVRLYSLPDADVYFHAP